MILLAWEWFTVRNGAAGGVVAKDIPEEAFAAGILAA
jgi:hypothetical protein